VKIEDRLLFLKYALPCASTLVKRGVVTQERVDGMIALVSEGKLPEDGAERIFRVANAMCESIARRMGKGAVDAEVIRTYFLLEHSKVVDERFESMKDFNPVACKTYAGRVIEAADGLAMVETVLGKQQYKTLFAKDVKKNDDVAVHFDFVVEKISAETAGKMSKG
jgi:hypothetical protein